jgi:hypothetical protein
MLRHSIAVLVGLCILLPVGCSSTGPSEPAATPQVSAPAVSPLEHKMIRRAGSTPEDGKVYIVEGGKKHWVVNAGWFAAHGYHFPTDIHVISADELAAVPTGDPIQ